MHAHAFFLFEAISLSIRRRNNFLKTTSSLAPKHTYLQFFSCPNSTFPFCIEVINLLVKLFWEFARVNYLNRVSFLVYCRVTTSHLPLGVQDQPFWKPRLHAEAVGQPEGLGRQTKLHRGHDRRAKTHLSNLRNRRPSRLDFKECHQRPHLQE